MTRRRSMVPQDHAARFQRAMRLLLARPLLVAGLTDDDDYRLVRSLSAELREWFDRETGWRLYVDAQTARLYKVVSDRLDATHPGRDPRTQLPFGRHRYVLTCLALAVLERADQQITLGRLAEQVVLASADPDLAAAGFHFALDRRDQRADLVAVVRLQIEWGTLRRVGGDEDAYLASTGDVLYDVDRHVLASLLAVTVGPSLISTADFERRLAALVVEVVPDTEDLRNRSLRHSLTRRLLEDPVVYLDELTDAELAYLSRQRTQITGRITDATGLIAEVRAEGIAMVDPDDDLTDVRMPAQGMLSHLALLLAERIAAKPDGVGVSELEQLTRELALEHKAYWRKNATDPSAEIDLVRSALTMLTALKLVTVGAGIETGNDQVVIARPAIARYALAEPTIRNGKPGVGDAR